MLASGCDQDTASTSKKALLEAECVPSVSIMARITFQSIGLNRPPPPVPCVCSRSLRARGMQALCPDCNPVQRDDPKTTTQIFHSIVTSKIRSWIAVENKANTTANRPRMLLPDPLTNMLNKTHSSRRGIVSAKFCFPPRAAGTAATHPSPASRKTLSHKLPSSCVCRRLAASFAPPPTPRGAR